MKNTPGYRFEYIIKDVHVLMFCTWFTSFHIPNSRKFMIKK